MNPSESRYGQLLLGLIDGDLTGADRAEAVRLQEVDADFSREVESLRRVATGLDAACVEYDYGIPQVDLLDRVLALIDSDAGEDTPVAAALMALGDAWRASLPQVEIDPEALTREDLDSLERDLESLGKANAESIPSVLLSSSIINLLPVDEETAVEPALEASLWSAAASLDRAVPQVDLWDAITRQLEVDTESSHGGSINVVEFPSARPVPRRKPDLGMPRWLRAATVAAAASLLVAVGLAYRASQPARIDLAGNAVDPDLASPVESSASAGGFQLTQAVPMDSASGQPATEGMLEDGTEEGSVRRPLTLKEVVDAYQHSVRGDAIALGKMAAWASLSREEARVLLEQADLTPEAVLGASEFLSPEEAIAVLQAAVDNDPNDPHLRYALASRFQETNDSEGYRRSLEEWRAVDPDNALPHYLGAQLMFASGNVEGGIAAMHAGVAMGKGSNYASQSARARAAALEASGRDADTARYLAAASAGEQEYDSMHALGSDLMEQARALEAAGDYEGAADLYDAIRLYGEQMLVGADVPAAQLAALEIQNNAVAAMMVLQEVWTPETFQALTLVADGIATGLSELGNLLGDVTQALGSDTLTQTLNYTDAILSGDMNRLWQLTSGQ